MRDCSSTTCDPKPATTSTGEFVQLRVPHTLEQLGQSLENPDSACTLLQHISCASGSHWRCYPMSLVGLEVFVLQGLLTEELRQLVALQWGA